MNGGRHYETQRRWAQANREKVRSYKRKHNKKIVESGASAAGKRRCIAKKPELYKAYVSSRRRKLRNATPPWADWAEIKSVYVLASMLGLTVDHIIPIDGEAVCGLHVPWNMQLLTLSENSKKRNSFTEPSLDEVRDWAERKTPIDTWFES